MGCTLEDVFPHIDRRHARELWRRFLEEGSQSGEVRLSRADGSTIDLEYRAVAHFAPGCHLSVLRELGLRRSLEERRIRSLSTLARGLSHNFNNALAAMTLAADEARSGARHGSEAGFDELELAIRRSADLVRRFALFARFDEPDLAPVDLVALLSERARAAGCGFESRVAAAEWTTPLDATLLRVAVDELLANAVEAMSGHPGHPRLELAREGEAASEVAVILIHDAGPGMSSEVRQQLFDPFFTTRSELSRTGLGASLAWGAVEALGGRLACRSQLDRGTTIEIRLPIRG